MTTPLIEEYKTSFEKIKKQLAFKANYDTIEDIFFMEDQVQHDGFVSSRLSRTLASRICNLFMSWNNYFHDLCMPNPASMILHTESELFTEAEKKEFMHLMTKILAHVRKSQVIGITKNTKEEGAFIDESVTFWQETLKPAIETMLKKIQHNWDMKAKNGVETEEKKRFT